MGYIAASKLEYSMGGKQSQDAMQSIRICTYGGCQFWSCFRSIAERIGHAEFGYDMQAPG
jgi:hypothetical protein